jgi:hypothetical protein
MSPSLLRLPHHPPIRLKHFLILVTTFIVMIIVSVENIAVKKFEITATTTMKWWNNNTHNNNNKQQHPIIIITTNNKRHIDIKLPWKIGPRLNGRLFLTGAQITIPHQDSSNQVLIHIFAATNSLFSRESMNRKITRWKETGSRPLGLRRTLWTKFELQSLDLFSCRFFMDDDTRHPSSMLVVPAEMLHIDNLDRIAGDTTHIWQCDLSQIWTRELLLQKPLLEFEFILNIDTIMAQNPSLLDNVFNITNIIMNPIIETFTISTHTGSVGWGGPQNELSTSIFAPKQPLNLMLCVGGIDRGGEILLLPFINYHINLGVDLIVIGIHESPSSKYFLKLRTLVLPFIELGYVQLADSFIDKELEIYGERDAIKMQFYNSCLYYGKTRARYVATFDADEYFYVPFFKHDPLRSLAKVIEKIDLSQKTISHVGGKNNPSTYCPNWCYVSFQSFTTHGHNSTIRKVERTVGTGFFPLDYRFRERNSNWIWQKSIVQSAMAFSSGFHFPGTCLVEMTKDFKHNDKKIVLPKHSDELDTSQQQQSEFEMTQLVRGKHPCAIQATNETLLGSFRHYQGLFYTDSHEPDEIVDMVEDEFTEFAIEYRKLFDEIVIERV